MIEKLIKIADRYIGINQSNPKQLEKYKLIKKILNKKDCFLNISIDYAYSILRDLQIPDHELKSTYMQLIDLSKNNDSI